MTKFFEIADYSKNTDPHYGTSGFSFYLYGLIKMIKPYTVIELGTGVGTTCFLAAQACKENNKGKVITIDSGVDETQSNFNIDRDFYNLRNQFELNEFLELRNFRLDFNNLNKLNDIEEVNILFNDIDCGPHNFLTLLNWILPRVNTECYYIIDRGATYWPNYCVIELTLEQLNKGKIPDVLLGLAEDQEYLRKLIQKFKFSVQHVLKNVDDCDTQDSFSVVKIEINNIGYRMI